MRRWAVYGLVLAAAFALKPLEMKDIGELIPVELLYISMDAGNICAETDTGEVGIGPDLESALEDLKATAEGSVFLETADYLIVTQRTAHLLPKLTHIVRPSAEVCIGIGADAQAVSYLKAHPSEVTMKDIRAGKWDIPTLVRKKERYYFGETWRLVKTA